MTGVPSKPMDEPRPHRPVAPDDPPPAGGVPDRLATVRAAARRHSAPDLENAIDALERDLAWLGLVPDPTGHGAQQRRQAFERARAEAPELARRTREAIESMQRLISA